ncbi:hypothetical protein CCACVL1_24391 [Corchorus capsularis]|uniref:Uncharacterized protein n=1 Tax=Corchorus capsularis TaxID=210143 RepID=A0A1R3GPS7_COCAP|nr:hypothetical protein CCACVL1_24391 [Corchorus capsularis]
MVFEFDAVPSTSEAILDEGRGDYLCNTIKFHFLETLEEWRTEDPFQRNSKVPVGDGIEKLSTASKTSKPR